MYSGRSLRLASEIKEGVSMSIRKTKHGTYLADVYDVNGKKILRTFKQKIDAVAFETKMKNDKREKMLIRTKIKTEDVFFEQALNEFIDSKLSIRNNTLKRYETIVEQFKLFIEKQGLKHLSDFTSDHATLYLIEVTKERNISSTIKNIRKPKTANMHLSLIKAFFNYEVMKGRIQTNPMRHVKNLKVQKPKPEYYTDEEVKKFFSQKINTNYRLAFQGLLYTGMRFAELANVHWSDVDFKNKLIRVSRKPGFDPKTQNSERRIPLAEPLYKELLELSNQKISEIFVFTSPMGKKLRERRLLVICKKIATSAGITSRAFLHKFRHTFATHLVLNRVPLERVQKLLGHSSINETLIYAHLIPDEMHEDVNVLNNLGKSETT